MTLLLVLLQNKRNLDLDAKAMLSNFSNEQKIEHVQEYTSFDLFVDICIPVNVFD